MIIFIYGPDTFRAKEKLKGFKNRFIQKFDKPGLNLVKLEGENLSLERFKEEVVTSSFLAKRKMIIVENPFNKNKNFEEELLNYIKTKKIPEENIIIFYQEEKIHLEKNKLFNFLEKQKYVYEFKFLGPGELSRWIRKKVSDLGGKITPQALRLLASQIGNDLWRLNQEIDKLLAYSHKKIIQEKDINILVKGKEDQNIFNLIDSIAQKNKRKALELINEQLENGVSELYLLTMLIRQFRILMQVKDEIENGGLKNSYTIASKLNLHPFVAQKALGQVISYTMEELKNIYRRLLDVDVKLKTTNLDPKALLSLLVVEA